MAGGDVLRYFDLPLEEREAILLRMAEAAEGLEGVRLLVVYGSFLDGGPFRDIDVAAAFDPPRSGRSPGPVEDALRLALGGLAVPVEVVPLDDAAPHFRASVLERGRVLLVREPRQAIEEWVRAKSESLDFDAWRRTHEGRRW